MFIDLDMDFHFWWLSYIQLFLLLSVTWVHSDIQVNVTVWSLLVFLLGKQGWQLVLKPLLDQNCEKKVKFMVKKCGGFVCFFKSRWNYQYIEYMKCTVMFYRLRFGLHVNILGSLIVLLISFLVLLLFVGCSALVLKCCALAVARERHPLTRERHPLTERVNPVWSAAGVSAVCWASHIACGTDLLFVFFF